MMTPMTGRKDEVALKRLAALVHQRRLELGMDKIEVARAADLTITTYGKIETGQSVRDTSYGKLEPVFYWAPGTCLDVLNGATAPAVISEHVGHAETSPVLPGDLADDIGDVVQDAAIHVADTLTASQIRELKLRVVETLRERGILAPHHGS